MSGVMKFFGKEDDKDKHKEKDKDEKHHKKDKKDKKKKDKKEGDKSGSSSSSDSDSDGYFPLGWPGGDIAGRLMLFGYPEEWGGSLIYVHLNLPDFWILALLFAAILQDHYPSDLMTSQ